jgi:hypothetical protein
MELTAVNACAPTYFLNRRKIIEPDAPVKLYKLPSKPDRKAPRTQALVPVSEFIFHLG